MTRQPSGSAVPVGGSQGTEASGLIRTLVRFGGPQMVEFLGGAVVGVAVGVLSARALGVEGRGVFAFMLQVGYVLQAFLVAGSDRAALSYVGRVDRREIFRTQLSFMLLVSGTAAALGAFVVAGGLVTGTIALAMVGLVIVFGAEESSRRLLQIGTILQHRPWMSVQRVLPAQAVIVATAVLFTVFEVDEPSVWMLTYLVPYGVIMLAWIGHERRRTTVMSPRDLRPFARDALAFLPGSLSLIVALRSDRILLGILSDAQQVGIYVTAATLMELMVAPTIIIGDILQSRWAAKLGGRSPVHAMSAFGPELVVIPAIAIVIAVGAWLATKVLVVPVFGDDYREATDLALPLGIAAGILAARTLCTALAVVVGKKAAAVRAEAIMAAVAVIGFVALIPKYESMGAAWASVAAYTVGLALVAMAVISAMRGGTTEVDQQTIHGDAR